MKETFISIKAVNQANQVREFHIHLNGSFGSGLPVELGTGRNAVVFLAATTPLKNSDANTYHAIKFLRNDIDTQYARASARRFFEEISKAKQFNLLQGTFVSYFGVGAIGRPESPDERGMFRDFWWQEDLKKYIDMLKDEDEKNYEDMQRILKHYDLQGPFYVLDLCQGTLYDLLDKSTPWIDLPAYTIANFHNSLLSQAKYTKAQIEEFTREYMIYSPERRTGYDILNGFKREAVPNRVRSRAVLQVFDQVVDAVAQLHRRPEPDRRAIQLSSNREPLAHRDLKPGNVFFQHDAGVHGFRNIRIKLSDLGYVTNAQKITSGDFTLLAGQRGHDYQAPGSQYYRAPEQADLPIEVRVDIEPDSQIHVQVRGSKIDHIDIHDWLSISDIFNDHERTILENRGLFKIMDVCFKDVADGGYYYRLKLDKKVETSRKKDIQGQIIRSTGFQTDGFSLGSILYDMISGGKDPQLFYTYCIISLTSQFAPKDLTIDGIMEILVPQERQGNLSSEELNFFEIRHMIPALFQARNLDNLFELLQEIAFSKVATEERSALRRLEKLSLFGSAWQYQNIDEVIAWLVKSPYYQRGITIPSMGQVPEDARHDLAQRLKNYRFRNFHQVSDLLRDKRKEPIPRDILRIIVACMIRDVDGSYYVRDTQNGYNTDDNFNAATKIRADVQRLLSEAQFSLPEKGFPEALEAHLLFKLRSHAIELMEEENASDNLPALQ